MQTNQLKRNHPNRKRMIVARGGKRGKTAGRGGKGQSARAGNKRRPEWRDIIKRIPKLRGRGKNSNKSFQDRSFVVSLKALEAAFATNDSVSPETLIMKGLVWTTSGKIPTIKILGNEDVSKSLNISGCRISRSAYEKIIKAGGKVLGVDFTAKSVEKKIDTVVTDVSPKKTSNKVDGDESKEKKPLKKAENTKKEDKQTHVKKETIKKEENVTNKTK